jgi:ketosteroid isomerase-like protein
MKHSSKATANDSKGTFLFIVLVLFVFSLSLTATASAAAKTEGEIKAAMDKMNKAYKAKDLKGVMAMFAKSPAVAVIGSGKEKAVGYDAVRKIYEKDFTFWKMVTALDYKIFALSSSGKAAWLAADMSATYITGDGVVDVAGRFTAVLKKTGKNWQFVQTHFSFPADAPKVVVMNFKQIDTNQDGKVDFREINVVIKGLTAEDFKKLDTNNDNYLSDEEFKAIWGR